MQVRILKLSMSLIVVLAATVLFAPIYASAACCGCGMCWMKYYTYPPCSCPGEGGCGWCSNDDLDSSQFKYLDEKYLSTIASSTQGLRAGIQDLDVNAEFMELLSGGKCFREKAALSLLGGARGGLVPIRFN